VSPAGDVENSSNTGPAVSMPTPTQSLRIAARAVLSSSVIGGIDGAVAASAGKVYDGLTGHEAPRNNFTTRCTPAASSSPNC
jgi:hypothetical protein